MRALAIVAFLLVLFASLIGYQRAEREGRLRQAALRLESLGMASLGEESIQQWMWTTFGARDVDLHSGILLTSLPPKQRVEFTVDGMRYQAYLIAQGSRAAQRAQLRGEFERIFQRHHHRPE